MDLQAKLTSLLKEKEEQEQIEQKAHQRIIELNRLIKSAERLIKDANESFSKNLETEGPLTDAEMKRHFRTTAVIDDLAKKSNNHLSV